MRLTTILNRVVNYKRFVVKTARIVETDGGKPEIEFGIEARKNSKPVCSDCGSDGSTYDHQAERRFQFVPLWGMAVCFTYAMRRVDCGSCGVKVERVPWADGKSPVCYSFKLYLASWAKTLSWQEVGHRFGVNWYQVFEAVKFVVTWGLAHRDMSGVEAIGIDEIHQGKGHKYLTVVYQLCGPVRRLLYVGRGRKSEALGGFFEQMGPDWCGGLKHICTDMWKAYLKAIKKYAPEAVHILDRFHVMKLLGDAVDKIRRREARELNEHGLDLLKGLKYVFLKRPENLTESQEEALHGVMNKRLRTVRAYLWKEKFQLFWGYSSPYHARRYLHRWCRGAMHSRLPEIKKFVKTLRKHEPLILNWFRAKKAFSSGAVEGLNRKINLVTRKSYGFRSPEVLEIALFHTLGHLPEPPITHRFL